LGYSALGSLIGLMVSPGVISFSESVAYSIGQDPLGLPWFLLPGLIVPGMILIAFVRPDPKQIGMNLEIYYPGYKAPPRTATGTSTFRASNLLRNVPVRLAMVSNAAGQGNMSIVMVLTSLVLSHHGHSLGAIALAHMFHSMGMFAFTIPLGRLADRFGRGPIMFPGVATALLGASLVALTGAWWSVTLGTFLVGLGWAAANVAATALIADQSATHERGRAIGVNESFAGGISVVAALVTGPLIEWYGLPAAGLAAALIAAPPLLMLGASRVRYRARRRELAANPVLPD
jgi:predicted MFS family arabinose efflux permease